MSEALRDKVSKTLGFRVEEHEYAKAFKKIETLGLPSRKQVNEILVAILEELDDRDKGTL